MPIARPFFRTCRQFTDGHYAEGGRWEYIVDPRFAKDPEHYVRGFLLLLKDLQVLFDYIEPADRNLDCYSFRTHELLFRACVEVEANFKAILVENGYAKNEKDLNMSDYEKVNASHRLSSFQVKIPIWHGRRSVLAPFSAWATNSSPSWYQAYNTTKHNRHESFERASFENALNAIAGLVVLLSAQFFGEEFGPGPVLSALEGPNDGMESAIGGYFRVKYPIDWPPEERYDFDWQKLKDHAHPFQAFDYSRVATQK